MGFTIFSATILTNFYVTKLCDKDEHIYCICVDVYNVYKCMCMYVHTHPKLIWLESVNPEFGERSFISTSVTAQVVKVKV